MHLATGFDAWALTLTTFTPLVGLAVLLLIPRVEEELIKVVTLLTTLVTFGFTVYVMSAFDYDHTDQLQFQVKKNWIETIHVHYHMGVDGISLPLLGLSAFVTVLCVIYSWNHFPEPHNPKAFFALLLLLEVGMNGTFVGQDLILFFIFFEIVLLPMYFMIGVWGGPNREYASIKFFLFTLFGSALMLLSFLALYFKAGHTFDIPELIAAGKGGMTHGVQLLIFGGMFLGFAIKVPMFPFHTWLPDAHTEAPTVGSVLLAAILLKLGTYGFIRIALPVLPKAASSWAPWIGLLAVIGIIYGALGCLAQTDMKRLIAFSSVAHMGYVMLGISTLTSFGINAAVFGMVAHGLITGMLFFVAGSVQHGYGTARDVPARRLAHPGAEDGLDPRLLCDGFTRPARSGRLLGRVPGDRVLVQPRRRAERGGVPRFHGGCLGRHGLRRRLPALDVAEGGLRPTEARVRRRPCARRRHRGVDRVAADARPDRAVRHPAELDVPYHRWCSHRVDEGVRRLM